MVGAAADSFAAIGGGRIPGEDRDPRGARGARAGIVRRSARCTVGRSAPYEHGPFPPETEDHMTTPSRSAVADELLRRFAAALRASQLYSKGHPLITRNLGALVAAVESLHGQEPSTVIGIVGEKIIVDDAP